MCRYKNLSKPNHWRIVLFLENKKQVLNIQEKGHNERIQIKDRLTVSELSKDLNMAQSHVRKYLKELENLGCLNTCKFKGKIEVIL